MTGYGKVCNGKEKDQMIEPISPSRPRTPSQDTIQIEPADTQCWPKAQLRRRLNGVTVGRSFNAVGVGSPSRAAGTCLVTDTTTVGAAT